MKRVKTAVLATLCLGCIGSVALAHSGVKNPAVLARMENMKSIGAGMEVLSNMVKGKVAFDAAKARAAAGDIARHSTQTVALFEAPETDPKTEAKPLIWERFDDFTTKAGATETFAIALSQSLETPDDLNVGLMQLGASCKACHRDYKD